MKEGKLPVRDVAKRMGVSVATLYRHVGKRGADAQGVVISNELLAHVAPLGWEHIALTGDYDWNTSRPADGLRPLRAVPEAFALRAA